MTTFTHCDQCGNPDCPRVASNPYFARCPAAERAYCAAWRNALASADVGYSVLALYAHGQHTQALGHATLEALPWQHTQAFAAMRVSHVFAGSDKPARIMLRNALKLTVAQAWWRNARGYSAISAAIAYHEHSDKRRGLLGIAH